METITKILRKFSPDAKYFEKFETGIINTKIPDGKYLVTVTYNVDSKEIVVKNIKFNGIDITVYDQYIPNYEGVDEFFSKVYARIAIVERKQYTEINLTDLLKIRNHYNNFQENAKNTTLHYLYSIKDSSLRSWVSTLFVIPTLKSIYDKSNDELIKDPLFQEEDKKFLIDKNNKNIFDMAARVAQRVKLLISSYGNPSIEKFFDVEALKLSLRPIIIDLNELIDGTITKEELELVDAMINKHDKS